MNDVQAAPPSPKILEQLLINGDLSSLSANERLDYYAKVCESLGLNPLTKPFAYIKLNGKLVLYALRDCTEQLRKLHNVSISGMHCELVGEVYIVKANFMNGQGRLDQATGCVPIKGLTGENLANAYMKAETKCKRRGTLSICGLGMLDETEVESIPDAEAEGAKKFQKLTPIQPSTVVVEGPQGTAELSRAPVADPPAVTIGNGPERRALEAAIGELAKGFGIDHETQRKQVKDAMGKEFGVEHFADLTPEQFEIVFGWVSGRKQRGPKAKP